MPDFAGRSVWTAGIWTGAAAAACGAALGFLAAAILWLPVSGSNGSIGSAFRAGAITYLTSLHGGVVIDSAAAQFVPLGMTLIAAAIVYRFGLGLTDVAAELDEHEPGRLLGAGLVQAGSFAAASGLVALYASLGTSRTPVLTAMLGGFAIAALAGSIGLLRESELGQQIVERVDVNLRLCLRGAGVVALTYLGSAAVLVAGSLLVHHAKAEEISREVGGGLSGVPVLLLGVLAAPNVVIGAIGYLAGPGVAIGTGTHVGLAGGAHGLLPAFPPLAVAPSGAGAPAAGWLFAVLTPFVAAALLRRMPGVRGRVLLGTLVVTAGCFGLLAWLGGGGVGSGRLRAVGVSPWQLAIAVPLAVGLAAAVIAVGGWARSALAGRDDDLPVVPVRRTPTTASSAKGVAVRSTTAKSAAAKSTAAKPPAKVSLAKEPAKGSAKVSAKVDLAKSADRIAAGARAAKAGEKAASTSATSKDSKPAGARAKESKQSGTDPKGRAERAS